jgi:hypothetical protein
MWIRNTAAACGLTTPVGVVDCLPHPLLAAQEGPEPAPEDAHGGAPLPLPRLRQDVRTPGKQFSGF